MDSDTKLEIAEIEHTIESELRDLFLAQGQTDNLVVQRACSDQIAVICGLATKMFGQKKVISMCERAASGDCGF